MYYCHNCKSEFENPTTADYDELHEGDPFRDPWMEGSGVYTCPECGSEDISEV